MRKLKEEQENGYVNVSDTESSFDSTTLEIISSNMYRTSPYVNTTAHPPIDMADHDVFTFDINGCYRNAIYYNSHYDYLLFTVMDDPQPYKLQGRKRRPTGIYYIATEQTQLIKGNGWYHNPDVDYLLQNNLIKEDSIKYYIKASTSLPFDK